nr:hypothetical protein CFP56_24262 [Quercus suber]
MDVRSASTRADLHRVMVEARLRCFLQRDRPSATSNQHPVLDLSHSFTRLHNDVEDPQTKHAFQLAPRPTKASSLNTLDPVSYLRPIVSRRHISRHGQFLGRLNACGLRLRVLTAGVP